MADQHDLDQLRTATEAVLEHARNDETYRNEFLADPVSALAAAGVPADAAEHIGNLEMATAGDDTAGYMRTSGCDGLTCAITLCSNIPWTGHTGCGMLTLNN
jgi:hypothetical protein